MKVKLIGTTGEVEMEQQLNSFIIGKTVVDIKFTEWVSYPHETGGYSCLVLYEDVPPKRQLQIRILFGNGNLEVEQKVNDFIAGKNIFDIKLTEWVHYESNVGGYSALVIYERAGASRVSRVSGVSQKSVDGSEVLERSQQFDVL